MSLRLRRLLFIVAAIVVVGALVIAGIALATTIKSGLHNQVRNDVKQQLTTTQVGKASESIIEQSHVVSTMVGPGRSDWWQVESAFVPQWNMKDMWGKLAAKPKTVGFTLFYSDQNSNQFIAAPAYFLAFGSKADAQKVAAQYNSGDLASVQGAYNAFVLDKTMVLTSTSVSDGLVLTSKKLLTFKTAQDASNDVNKGYWYVSGKGLNAYMTQEQDKSANGVYLNLVKRLGFNVQAKPGSWYGTSTDGLNWQGRMFAVDSSSLWNAADLQVDAFYTYLQTTAKSSAKPTEEDFAKAREEAEKNGADPRGGSYTYFYNTVPMQSIIAQYFAIITDTKVTGTVTSLSNSSKTVKLSKTDSPNKITFVVDPNVWFNALNQPASSDVWHLFNFQQAKLTFYKNDQTRLDITLVQ
jgi:hypothetical protein